MISIIICTYNRPKKVPELIDYLKSQGEALEEIIVVDSTDDENSELKNEKNIRYVRSSFKNQPYQRYLGYLVSQNDWLLFLDDDMEPLEGWFDKVNQLIYQYGGTGIIGVRFEDKHSNTFLKNSPESILKGGSKKSFINQIRTMSGYPILPEGHYYKNGVKGPLPQKSGYTEYTSGGAFLAHRKFLYKNFNMQLFDLYDQRMGKGEDGILSYTVSKFAPLHYCSDQLFWHNDQGNSVYTQNNFRFNQVVAFSRAYLNFEYYRLNQKSIRFAKLNYFNYSLWRFVGMMINFLLKPTKARWEGIRGQVSGWIKGMLFEYDSELTRNSYWHSRAEQDLHESRQ